MAFVDEGWSVADFGLEVVYVCFCFSEEVSCFAYSYLFRFCPYYLSFDSEI